jgi:large subunit ribosomal protein L21
MPTYAVVNDRGRRFRVEPGLEVWIDRIRPTKDGGAEPGSKIVFDKVELVSGDAGVHVGTPLVKGAKVTAVVKGETMGKKVVVFKYKRRKSTRRKWGARDHFTRVEIEKIEGV